MEKTVTIKLVKSPITHPKNQRETLKALGLSKIGQTVTKVDNADEVSVEDILENGISIVPWVKVTMKKNCYLTVQEFQFVNLTAGDTLVSIDVQGKSVLNNNFADCSSCYYLDI